MKANRRVRESDGEGRGAEETERTLLTMMPPSE